MTPPTPAPNCESCLRYQEWLARKLEDERKLLLRIQRMHEKLYGPPGEE